MKPAGIDSPERLSGLLKWIGRSPVERAAATLLRSCEDALVSPHRGAVPDATNSTPLLTVGA